MKHKILMVSNNLNNIQTIKGLFEKQLQDIKIVTVNYAEPAMDMACQNKPSLIIIDKDLPDIPGIELLGILKKNVSVRDIPVIILAANSDDAGDEVAALSMGVCDYLYMTVDSKVIYARIVKVLECPHIKKDVVEETVKSGKIEMCLETHTVKVSGDAIELTPKEFALLYLFIKKHGKVLNRVFLSEAIWEKEYYETSRTIDRHVANLRKKLRDEGDRIETLPTVGYKFT